METQVKQIKAHLETGKVITAIDALLNYNCFRLSARIKDLKDLGYPVDKTMIQVESGKYIAQYFKVKQ
jgi:hypothetical protein